MEELHAGGLGQLDQPGGLRFPPLAVLCGAIRAGGAFWQASSLSLSTLRHLDVTLEPLHGAYYEVGLHPGYHTVECTKGAWT